MKYSNKKKTFKNKNVYKIYGIEIYKWNGEEEEENEEAMKLTNKYLPEWEQIATDEEGRRRFHGAFTGGYSAGYFNTVFLKFIIGWFKRRICT
jgi:hypothetical protein